MSLTQPDVDGILAASKAVATGAQISWTRRNEQVRVARVPVELGAIQVGEVIAIINVAHSRSWNFKLVLRGMEVRRWDFCPPGPCSHSNPKGRPPDWPGKVREHEHEHVWFEGLGTLCARPLIGMRDLDHREAYSRFCAVVNCDPRNSYQPPPPHGKQLQLS